MTERWVLTGTMCSSLILTYIARYSYLVNQLLLELAIWWHHVTYWTWLCNILLYIHTSDVSFRSRSIVKTFESSHGHTYPYFLSCSFVFFYFPFPWSAHAQTHNTHIHASTHPHISTTTVLVHMYTFVHGPPHTSTHLYIMCTVWHHHHKDTAPPHPCSGVTCHISPPQAPCGHPHPTPVVVLHVTYHCHKHTAHTPTLGDAV